MKQKIVAVAVALMIIIGGAYWLSLIDQSSPSGEQSSSTPTDKFRQDYPGVSDDHRFVYVSGERAIEVLKSGSGIVFLGFKECPWCQALAPQLDAAAEAEGLDEIYYLDIRQARVDNDTTYQQLVKILEEYLETDDNDQPVIYVPDVTAVRDGNIVKRYKMESSPDSLAATPEAYWTDERRQRAAVQLRSMVQAAKR